MPKNNIPPSELYSVSRLQIQFNDMGIGQRLIWLNNSQAFMFGVYAVATIMKAPTPILAGKEQALALIVPILGLAITLFTLFDILTNIRQMNLVTRNYKTINKGSEKESDFPEIIGSLSDRFFQRVSPIITALLFLAVWIFLILYDHDLIKL